MENYETENMTYFQHKAFTAFLKENISNDYRVKKSGHDGIYVPFFEIFDLEPDEMQKVVAFEKLLLSDRPLAEIKNFQTTALRHEYLSAIREEMDGEEHLRVLANIIRAPHPNDILLHRFKSSEYVEEMAEEMKYELQWMVTTLKDTQLTDLNDGLPELGIVSKAKEKLFNMASGDEYTTFMQGLQQFAKERVTELEGYDLKFSSMSGVPVVLNRNITEPERRDYQVVARLLGKEGIKYSVDGLSKDDIEVIERENKRLSGNHICIARASKEEPWTESIEVPEFYDDAEYKFISKNHESILRHYLNGQTQEIGINGTPISDDFIDSYREDAQYNLMLLLKKSDVEKQLEALHEVRTVNVIVIDPYGAVSVTSFDGSEAGIANAEKEFILKYEEMSSLSPDEDEKEGLLDDAHAELENGMTIILTHSINSKLKESLLEEKKVEEVWKRNSEKREIHKDDIGQGVKPQQ